MRVSDDVLELIALLNEEGFGFLAGELMTEISLGREIDGTPPDGQASSDAWSKKASDFADEQGLGREPIPLDEQLPAALSFLRLRLVEPVRQLAQAEEIAGGLIMAQSSSVAPASDRAVQITFRPVGDTRGARFDRLEPAGQAESANALDEAIKRLLDWAG